MYGQMIETMDSLILSHPTKIINGDLFLSGSKSISNRILIIRALCENYFNIENLSDSDDTRTLTELLSSKKRELDVHHAGTTFRFLTAYLSIKNKDVVLTGSSRMQQRPIGPLVDALRSLGAKIDYVKKEGYPPLKFSPSNTKWHNKVSLPAGMSSQYISALLLIAPTLPRGLELTLKGEVVSKPYIDMTLRIMGYYGIEHQWSDDTIIIPPQKYKAKDYYVEADWSGASYHFEIMALAGEGTLTLHGLDSDSIQGDQAIVEIAKSFGVESEYGHRSITLTKNKRIESLYEYDFLRCPDIAQTVSVMAAGKGVSLLMSGLQTLRIKETDRIAALQKELQKMKVVLTPLPEKFAQKSKKKYYLQEGKAIIHDGEISIDTYDDHRMAMSFAPLGLLGEVKINNPDVVTKSYPNFWKDLERLGFAMQQK